MAAKVASLLIDVAADVAKVRKDFGEMGQAVQGFGRTIETVGNIFKALIGVIAVERVLAFGAAIQANVDAMSDMAENLKIAVDDFQTLQNSALLAGQSVDATGAALAKFNVFIGKAAEGDKAAIETLQALGVTINDVAGKAKSTTDRLQQIAQAITAIEDPAKRSAAEVAVFGKTGQSVSAILEQWKRGTADLNEELTRLGLVHSPEVTKQLAAMADQADIGAKKIEVLFAPFYAAVKSNVILAIASAFKSLADSITALRAGSDVIGNLLNLLSLGGGGALASAFGKVGPDKQLLEDADKAAQAYFKMRDGIEAQKIMWGENSSAFKQYLADVEQARVKFDTLEKGAQKVGQLPVQLPPLTVTAPGGTNPAIVGGSAGVDKFAEAMKRLREETEATQAAIDSLSKTTNLPTKEAERVAKLAADTGTKISQMIKGVPEAQQEPIKQAAIALEKLKFQLDEVKETQRTGDAVNRQYGDGQKALADTLYYLDKALKAGVIGQREYAKAVEDANDAAALQAEVNKGLGEGIDSIAAGFRHAALAMSQSQTAFKQGEALFTATFQTMTDAIAEFVATGEFDFGKLAQSFAKMLAQMAVQWAASAIFREVVGGGILSPAAGAAPAGASGLTGGSIFSGLFSFLGGLFGGARASGGPVVPGMIYTVGETGPERFVPNMAGRIEPAGGGVGQVNVSVDMSGRSDTDAARDPATAMEFGRRLRVAVLDVIANEKRPGGTLYAR